MFAWMRTPLWRLKFNHPALTERVPDPELVSDVQLKGRRQAAIVEAGGQRRGGGAGGSREARRRRCSRRNDPQGRVLLYAPELRRLTGAAWRGVDSPGRQARQAEPSVGAAKRGSRHAAAAARVRAWREELVPARRVAVLQRQRDSGIRRCHLHGRGHGQDEPRGRR